MQELYSTLHIPFTSDGHLFVIVSAELGRFSLLSTISLQKVRTLVSHVR